MSWFHARAVASGIWLLAEPSHVNTWLVAGRDRAVLLDTGLGLAPIRPVAERATPLPLGVVNTHYHFDHTGGNHEFDDIAIHALGAPRLGEPVPREVLDAYLGYTARLLAAAEEYRRLDREFFHLLSVDSDPRELPPDADDWTIAPSSATRTLADGDRVELGGRELTVLHTPGHTPDCICLLDERAGILFGGDTINTGPIYAQFPDSDVAAFAHSTRRLAELTGDVRQVMVHHFGRTMAEPALLGEIADGFERLASGDVALEPGRDCVDGAVLEASFDRFSILVADPAAPLRDLTAREPDSVGA